MRNIIVYLGPKLPKYVKKNINYLSSTFPDQEFVILIDHAKNYSKKKLKNVEIIRCQDPIISWSPANQILSKENHFKNDFWYKTLARFKVLEEYMKDNNESIMHIEADVLLSKNFPFDRVKLIDKKFGYCLVTDKQGIASLLYIKNYEAAKILLAQQANAAIEGVMAKGVELDIVKEAMEEVSSKDL